jgi:hypothetical protein
VADLENEGGDTGLSQGQRTQSNKHFQSVFVIVNLLFFSFLSKNTEKNFHEGMPVIGSATEDKGCSRSSELILKYVVLAFNKSKSSETLSHLLFFKISRSY